MALPIIKVTRLIVGGNPFSGFSHRSVRGTSHQSPAKSREMVDYCIMERILAVLRDCQGVGSNAFLGRGDNFTTRVLNEHWNPNRCSRWWPWWRRC